MADKTRNTQRKHIRSEGTYSLDEIKSLTLDDGTRVITSADGDIKRPVCVGIDVHKETLMAAVCKTDSQTLNAVFYVRQFKSTNSDIRDLRELCRYRLKLTYMRTSEKNRFQNSMTVSKIRLDCVFSDPFGKSASSIMEYLIMTEPEDVSDEQILSMVDRRVKASGEDIPDSIHGYEFIGIQRDKLKVINLHLGQINECIRLIDEKLEYFRQKYSRII